MRDINLSNLIDPGVFQKGWNVNIQPVGAAEHSIRYLSHDVFKVAISDHRIVQAADDTVTFSYKKPKSRRTRYMTLNALDFISRFLQHSLPPGFMKVRYYGFMHACSGVCLENVRASIERIHAFEVTVPESTGEVHEKIRPICPDCGAELRYLYSVLPHQMPEYRGSG
jgi:hypothetical protein